MKKLILTALTGLFFFLSAPAQQLDRVLGDIIVQMNHNKDVHKLERSLQTFQAKPTQLRVERELSSPLRIWLLSFDFTTIDETALLYEIRRHPDVQEAQLNHLIHERETTPDDPMFGQQWQWVNTGQNGGTPDADVDADLAWDITTGGTTAIGQEIVVCIVEGGNLNHPDLKDNIWVNQAEIPGNGIDDDGNGYVDDYKGWNTPAGNGNIPSESHGTTVGGMIGAKGNNGLMVTGINWDIKLMYVAYGSANEANVIAAYSYPYIMRRMFNQSGGTEGAFVVATNSSWGIDNGKPENSPLWCAFYDSLGVEGILSCGSTSNSNVNIDVVGDLPTACPSEYLISVTASNRNDVRTFSGYGLINVDVAAPGENIVSISQTGAPTTTSGTSFASPLTAGIIGLLYSAPCSSIGAQAIGDPAGTALLIRDALFAGVDVKPNLVTEIKTGGRVNAFNSLMILQQSCGPCPKPYGMTLTEVVDTTALLSWKSTDSTLTTNLRWRSVGDSAWILVENAESPFLFTGLLACSEYEFQLEDFCADTTSGEMNPYIFKTDGCCEAPAELTVSSITKTEAVANWTPVYAAGSYNLQLSSPDTTILLEGLVETSFDFIDLEECTEYVLAVQTVCDTGLTDFSIPVIFKTFGCGACKDLTYCNSSASNVGEEWIAEVSIGPLNNSSGMDDGYGDYTGDPVELETYNAYPVLLTPGFIGSSFPEGWAVWIDYNQDGDFNDPGEKVFDSGSPKTAPASGQIVVPGAALPGLTRLRVVMRFSASPASCNAYNFGETEDYCVVIVPGQAPDCHAPVGLEAYDIGFNNAAFQWNKVGDAQSYELRYRIEGNVNWSALTVGDTTRAVSNLQACSDYEVQVRALCLGATGDWSNLLSFSTDCYPPCENIPTGLDTSAVSKNSVRLHWNSAENALKYRIGYRKAGAPGYSLILAQDTAYVLSGLSECTDYQFIVRSICVGEVESESSDVFDFRTECTVGTEDLAGNLSGVGVFPNPFNSKITATFNLRLQQEVFFELFDARGQRISASSGVFPAGENRFTMNPTQTGALPSGVYLLKMAVGNGYVVRKLMKEQAW